MFAYQYAIIHTYTYIHIFCLCYLYIPSYTDEVEGIVLAAKTPGAALRIIFDSGATTHILPTRESMTNYRVKGGVVQLGDQSVELSVKGVGDTELLQDVLHVPRMSFGLISVSRLDQEGHISIFRNGRVWILDTAGTLVCTGTRNKSLYFLDAKYHSQLLDPVDDGGTQQTDDYDVHYAALQVKAKRFKSTTAGFNDLELLHQR
jgi:hypothetical protein